MRDYDTELWRPLTGEQRLQALRQQDYMPPEQLAADAARTAQIMQNMEADDAGQPSPDIGLPCRLDDLVSFLVARVLASD